MKKHSGYNIKFIIIIVLPKLKKTRRVHVYVCHILTHNSLGENYQSPSKLYLLIKG